MSLSDMFGHLLSLHIIQKMSRLKRDVDDAYALQ